MGWEGELSGGNNDLRTHSHVPNQSQRPWNGLTLVKG
jgi:hypothetical protein